MSAEGVFKQGRGSQINPTNRFESLSYRTEDSYLEYLKQNEEDVSQSRKTQFIKVYPKTIVNKVTSPDVGMQWSINPYQGCEHGCAYCYARNSHEYWGYNAGGDFEEVILVKENAPDLLIKHLRKKSWRPQTIVLSGNTDCYQPAERQFEITRKLLEIFLEYRNPVGIITKNALLQRDLDIYEQLQKRNLVRVNISITSLDENLRRRLEPRTATAHKRLETVRKLSEIGVPVNVMIAPVIAGLNSHEVFNIARASAEAGASSIAHTMVRLNGQIGKIFMDWVQHHYPDRAEKIQHQIEETHGGTLNDSDWGRRIRGEGQIADQVKSMMSLARKKFFAGKKTPAINTKDFRRPPKNGQTLLF